MESDSYKKTREEFPYLSISGYGTDVSIFIENYEELFEQFGYERLKK